MNIGVVADAMSGVVVNVCLRVFPMLCQLLFYCSIFVEAGGGEGVLLVVFSRGNC